LFRSDVEGFRVEPALRQTLAPVGFTVPEARVDGIGARYEQQIGRFLSGYLRYTYNDVTDRTTGPTRGRQLPLSPRSRAVLGLNFIDRAGTKLFLDASWSGGIYLDPLWSNREEFDPLAPRPTFPARWRVDLRLARERTVRREWVLNVSNLFNTGGVYWAGFPRPGRALRLEYRIRF
jgi:outer membrane receptor protein involved in Fe transport